VTGCETGAVTVTLAGSTFVSTTDFAPAFAPLAAAKE
jgi:hypothetical protein